jgi:hypothetical protein
LGSEFNRAVLPRRLFQVWLQRQAGEETMVQDSEQSSEQSLVPAAPSEEALSPAMLQIERSLAQNISDLGSLRTMPVMLVSFLRISREMHHVSVDYARGIRDGWNLSHDIERLRLLEEYASDTNGFRKLWSTSEAELERMCSDPSYGPLLAGAMRVLKMSVVSGCWTALECVATDCWIAGLNACPTQLAQRVLASTPHESDGSEISSKQISLGLAAKYGFDLQHRLGTILKSKFDFTSISGIRRAYNAAFKGWGPIDKLNSLMSRPLFRELELTRNLIVHRGGLVDAEYNSLMSTDFPLDKPLEVSDKKADDFTNQVAVAGSAILHFVSDFIEQSHRK